MADHTEGAGGPTARERARKIIANLPLADSFPLPTEKGVLLSDKIAHYAKDYHMIQPFNPEQLKPAGYELTVGTKYSLGGESHSLTPPNAHVTIKPFDVAIIQVRELISMPNFLIGRWNLKVGRAYDGLLWVGAAQVDPGWSGWLSCPLYNLSEKPITLKYGDPIALIDFVTTTTPTKDSIPYKSLDNPARLLAFEEYRADSLRSGVVTLVLNRVHSLEATVTSMNSELDKRFERAQNRIDTFTSITFFAISILVAAVAAIASNGGARTEWPGTVALGCAALLLALLSLYFARVHIRPPRWHFIQFLAGVLTAAVVFFLAYDYFELPRLRHEMQSLLKPQVQAVRPSPSGPRKGK